MPTLNDIRETFALIDDWEERYRYLIDLGRLMPAFPDEARDEAHRVLGCTSRVWLVTQTDGMIMTFVGDSDAHLVKGLVAVVLAVYSGLSAAEILATPIEPILGELGLNEHLTPQRSNGLKSMVMRIQRDAQTVVSNAV